LSDKFTSHKTYKNKRHPSEILVLQRFSDLIKKDDTIYLSYQTKYFFIAWMNGHISGICGKEILTRYWNLFFIFTWILN